MKKLVIIGALFLFVNYTRAQTVVVNPDGSHSVIIKNGNTSTLVNPDGSHSTIIKNEKSSTVVKPDGSHSIILHHDSPASEVNSTRPDSTLGKKNLPQSDSCFRSEL